jgi:hypothetical protein
MTKFLKFVYVFIFSFSVFSRLIASRFSKDLLKELFIEKYLCQGGRTAIFFFQVIMRIILYQSH